MAEQRGLGPDFATAPPEALGRFMEAHRCDEPGQKTCRWTIVSRGGEGFPAAPLGTVRWYAPWRRYVFHPEEGTLFDAGCLAAIAGFCMKNKHTRQEAQRG